MGEEAFDETVLAADTGTLQVVDPNDDILF